MRPRVLFVFSRDFGEVVNADLFCRGGGFDTMALLPDSSPADPGSTFGASRRYAGVDEIVDACRRFQPQTVILASAYLLAVNDILSPAQLGDLVGRLSAMPVVLATTDPWMGYWRHRPDAGFCLHGIADSGQRRQAEQRLRQHQLELDRLLDPLCHLYAIPYRDPSRRSFHFFNAVDAAGPSSPTLPSSWLLVLSHQDETVQRRRHGAGFPALLSRAVDALVRHGAERVVLVASAGLAQRLRPQPETQGRLHWIGHPGLERFRDEVARAEHVVYWNLLSSSLLYAYYAGKRIVFLDPGHQVEVSPGFRAHVDEYVFAGRAAASVSLEDVAATPPVGDSFDDLRRIATGCPPAAILRELAGEGVG